MSTPVVEKILEGAPMLREGKAIYFVAPAEVIYERLRKLGLRPEDIDLILKRGGCEKVISELGDFIACPIAKATDRGVEIITHNLALMEASLEYIKKLLKVK